MSLDEYRRKRDFTKSPEPAGEAKKARAGRKKARYFCVHKHLSSHLHYDLRLEHGGVLMSWAVPKGPALDPGIKRLAMRVEDHPIEYGHFEGVIPEGYGAGIVMLWDYGTWEPQDPDLDRALAKGDVKFTLDGFKLKGSWVLVRTRGYGDARSAGKSWLLIKHRDEWSGDLDITEFAPLSVKSEGDFADILAAEQPAQWVSPKPGSGGETSAMLRRVIEDAVALRVAQEAKKPARKAAPAGPSTTTKRSARPAGRRRKS